MSDELILREAIPSDAKQLIEFYKKISEYDFVEISNEKLTVMSVQNNLAAVYDSSENNLVIALNDDQLIGFCNIDHGELGIVVDKNYWHYGVGSELMYDSMMWFEQDSDLDKIWLEVYKENEPAINLYKKFGFTITQETDKTLTMQKKDD